MYVLPLLNSVLYFVCSKLCLAKIASVQKEAFSLQIVTLMVHEAVRAEINLLFCRDYRVFQKHHVSRSQITPTSSLPWERAIPKHLSVHAVNFTLTPSNAVYLVKSVRTSPSH